MTSEMAASEIAAPRDSAVADWTPRVVCGLIGAVFLLAAALKAVRPEGLTGALTVSIDISDAAAVIGGAALVAIEAAIGLALFIRPFRRAAGFIAMAMLGAFTVYLAAFHAPDAGGCGCFGLDTASPIASSIELAIARNTLLLFALAIALLTRSPIPQRESSMKEHIHAHQKHA